MYNSVTKIKFKQFYYCLNARKKVFVYQNSPQSTIYNTSIEKIFTYEKLSVIYMYKIDIEVEVSNEKCSNLNQ